MNVLTSLDGVIRTKMEQVQVVRNEKKVNKLADDVEDTFASRSRYIFPVLARTFNINFVVTHLFDRLCDGEWE